MIIQIRVTKFKKINPDHISQQHPEGQVVKLNLEADSIIDQNQTKGDKVEKLQLDLISYPKQVERNVTKLNPETVNLFD